MGRKVGSWRQQTTLGESLTLSLCFDVRQRDSREREHGEKTIKREKEFEKMRRLTSFGSPAPAAVVSSSGSVRGGGRALKHRRQSGRIFGIAPPPPPPSPRKLTAICQFFLRQIILVRWLSHISKWKGASEPPLHHHASHPCRPCFTHPHTHTRVCEKGREKMWVDHR